MHRGTLLTSLSENGVIIFFYWGLAYRVLSATLLRHGLHADRAQVCAQGTCRVFQVKEGTVLVENSLLQLLHRMHRGDRLNGALSILQLLLWNLHLAALMNGAYVIGRLHVPLESHIDVLLDAWLLQFEVESTLYGFTAFVYRRFQNILIKPLLITIRLNLDLGHLIPI